MNHGSFLGSFLVCWGIYECSRGIKIQIQNVDELSCMKMNWCDQDIRLYVTGGYMR